MAGATGVQHSFVIRGLKWQRLHKVIIDPKRQFAVVATRVFVAGRGELRASVT